MNISSNLEIFIREAIVQYVLEEYGVHDPKVDLSSAAQNGDNFASDVFRVKIDGVVSGSCSGDSISHSDCHPLRLQLIIKTSPRDTVRREMYKSSLQFAREHYTYTVIFPAFERFQLQYLDTSQIFAHYPRMLQSDLREHQEFIILEDLCLRHYHTTYRPQALCYTKCMSVITTLARFHAISFAYKDQQPNNFQRLTDSLDEITFRDTVNKVLDPFLYRFIECGMTTLSDSEEDRKVKGRLERSREMYADLMRRCVGAKDDAVILHGDCWMSNIMFREEVQADTTDVSLIDWQGTRYGSPAIDLSYFLFCCTDSVVREQLPTILRFYHDELVKRIAELGSEGRRIFPFINLEKHMQKYARFGLGMAILTLHVTTCDPDDMPNLKQTMGKHERDNFINHLVTREAYRERMAGVFRDVIKYGYL